MRGSKVIRGPCILRISDLKPNPKNPRTISDDRLKQFKKSLSEFGDLSGIINNKKSGQLCGGHQRIKLFDEDTQITITKKYSNPTKTGTIAEGYVTLEGEKFSYREVMWTEAKEKAANIAANRGAGDWDLPQLSEWLKELNSFDADFDMELTMFGADELKEFSGITVSEHSRTSSTGVDEDEVPEKPKARTKLGDVYSLGVHRLLCGDSTDVSMVESLMNGEKVDITFTSPPYNLGKFNVTDTATNNIKEPKRKQKYLTVTDDMTPEKYEEFIFNLISICLNFSESVLVNIGLMEANKRPVMRVVNRLIDQFKETLYWKKSASTPHIQPGIVTTLVEPIFCFGEFGSRMFRTATFKGNCPNVIEGVNAGGNEFAAVHAATFPVYFPQWIIENFSRKSVYDPFGGTGTTMIAAEKTNRKCFMMELDPHYCDIIVERWEKYTGQKAELVPKIKTVIRKPVKQTVNTRAKNH